MHQKGSKAAPSVDSGRGDELDENDNEDGRDPFADGDDDDDDDDDGGYDNRGTPRRGAWWRSVVGRGGGRGESDEEEEDEDEFGDFTSAEGGDEVAAGGSNVRGGDSTGAGSVLLKPLAVNPSTESARGQGGLWPFNNKNGEGNEADREDGNDPVVTGGFRGAAGGTGGTVAEVREAKRRTSIEDPEE